MRLALVLDKSQSFRDYQRSHILDTWGVGGDVSQVDNLGAVGVGTIFGGPPSAVLSLDDIPSLKRFVADLEALWTSGGAADQLAQGLVVVSGVPRTSTRKLEQLVATMGGEVVLARESSRDRESVAGRLLNSLAIGPVEKQFLEDYVADDYDALLSVLRSLESLTPAQQARITVADLAIRMPQIPGSIPPWEIEGPLFAGDVNRALELYRRITAHSHHLVVLAVLKNKVQLAWKVAALEEQGVRSLAALAEALGVANNFPLKLAQGLARRMGRVPLGGLVSLLARAEADIKGGSLADDSVTMEIALVEIAQKMKMVK